MTQSASILSRSSLQTLTAPSETIGVEPVWRLLLTAIFAAAAALCFAAVVIFGAPGEPSIGSGAGPVQVVVHATAS